MHVVSRGVPSSRCAAPSNRRRTSRCDLVRVGTLRHAQDRFSFYMRITPLLLIIALIIGGCSLWQASGPETGSARADETAREKRARVAACMDRETALAMRDTMVVDQCDDRTLIVCFNERDLTVEVDGKPVRVECEDSNVVDVDFGDDDRRWRAVAWSGMRIANVLPRRKTAPRPPADRKSVV